MATKRVLDNTDFIQGTALRDFEDAFADYIGVKRAVGVACGLDALTLTLRALDIGAGDEVIVPGITFIATALAVIQAGATPVPVDCCNDTWNIDPDGIAAAITPRTAAIMPVHFAGRAADMTSICNIADRHGLAVIEDAAQAHGAELHQRRCGAWGAAGCFSFYPSKNLGAAGDGGMVVTDDSALADRIRTLANYGQVEKNRHTVAGVNSRLDTLQAAMLQVKLGHLDEWNQARMRHAHAYREGLADIPGLDLPAADTPGSHVHHLFVVLTDDRDGLQEFLTQKRISSGVHYRQAIHQHEAFQGQRCSVGSLPVSEDYAKRCLSLPMFPELSTEQTTRVADAVREFFKG
jgi:dTDP-4-amino-4,6-dideoxygalactose transaminase